MRIETFDYLLPKEFIAQYPSEHRVGSRLLVLDRANGSIQHTFFNSIAEYLTEGDILVLNESKVLPVRLKANKYTGGAVEILLVEEIEKGRWLCLARGAKRGNEGVDIRIGDVPAHIEKRDEFWEISLPKDADIDKLLQDHGQMPLPPYIKRKNGDGVIDSKRYQTVYARTPGSIAAPTAGFHFTDELLRKIEKKGVDIVKITLHIGIGTFFLIKVQNVEDHRMHREYYEMDRSDWERIKKAKREGRRIVACGTSAVRTLETMSRDNGAASCAGYTELYIYPGHSFRMVDAMITNFHLPRSTPLMLVSAFAGRDAIMASYGEAVDKGYRFYSYGDAMLIV